MKNFGSSIAISVALNVLMCCDAASAILTDATKQSDDRLLQVGAKNLTKLFAYE
jgi:hypothetical protein